MSASNGLSFMHTHVPFLLPFARDTPFEMVVQSNVSNPFAYFNMLYLSIWMRHLIRHRL